MHAYDEIGIKYASDTRAINNTCIESQPFLPSMGGREFNALQIPSTLPTLDELIGRTHYPLNSLQGQYLNWIQDGYNVMTIHAELEGMAYLNWFTNFVDACLDMGIQFVTLGDIYNHTQNQPHSPIKREIKIGTIDGRSGTLGL